MVQEESSGILVENLVAFLFLGIAVVGGCLIKNISDIIDWMGCIVVNTISFILPALWFYLAKKKFNKQSSTFWNISAIA